MATRHCYVVISPDPRHWAPVQPAHAQVPGTTVPIAAPPGGNFFIKIGSQTGANGARASYRRANPSFYWSNIEVTNYVAPPAPNNTRTLGKQLEIDVIGGLPARMLAAGLPGEVFKHIQHGEEWYYCFNNQAFLLALINYLENNKVAGQDFVRFANTNAAKVAIEGWFRTA
ncbi:hypothetical protein EYR36_007926 [Pleurotus pulmonarius]|nr:hypothetical protein EYR36_007926 [Pleurotus pulmonarius]